MPATSAFGVLCLVLFGASSVQSTSISGLLDAAQAIQPWLVATRRELHQWPELLFELQNTSKYIRSQLDELKIPYKYPVAKEGIVATIGKGKPVVGLRADMDALPIQEKADVPFRSKIEGKMHACGHDSHMTMLLGAAKLLKARELRGELQGTVKLFFQPAEEGGAGGQLMVQEGATKGVEAMFGMHVWPTIPSGVLASREGPLMAASNIFEVTVKGRGGHAAMPHLSRDPIVAAAHAITAVQVLASRETSPVGSAVVSVTRVQGGEGAFNVIPAQATFGGTMRSLEHEHIMRMKTRFVEVVQRTAEAFGCTAEVNFFEDVHPYYPPTVNDAQAYKFAMDVGEQLVGKSNMRLGYEPTMAGEDFSFFGQSGIPSTFVFLGIGDEAKGTVHGLHTGDFKLDEDVLKLGAAYHTALATQFLEQKGKISARDEL